MYDHIKDTVIFSLYLQGPYLQGRDLGGRDLGGTTGKEQPNQ